MSSNYSLNTSKTRWQCLMHSAVYYYSNDGLWVMLFATIVDARMFRAVF